MQNKIFLFPIDTTGVTFKYRLIEIKITGGDPGKKLNILVNKAKTIFARKFWELERNKNVEKWSVLLFIENCYYIAAPLNFRRELLNLSVKNMHWNIIFNETTDIYTFNFDNIRENYESELAMGWLNDQIRLTMLAYENIFWQSNHVYYFREPANVDIHKIDMYKGFSLKIYKQHKGYALCIEDTVKYLDKNPVEWYIKRNPALKFEKPRYAIYKEGSDWYHIKILEQTKATINEQILFPAEKSLYQYLKEKHSTLPASSINKESLALKFQYPNNSEKTLFANGAWVYFTYKSDVRETRAIQSSSIIPPSKRKGNVEQFVGEYFSKSKFKVAVECLSIKSTYFPVPELQFGNNFILKPYNHESGSGIKLDDWLFNVKKKLLENGTAHNGILATQYLIVPSTMPRNITDKFKEKLIETIKTITRKNCDFQISQYQVPSGKPSLARYCESIKQHLDNNALLNQHDDTIILVLPKGSPSNLHNHLKRLLEKKRSQFLVESYDDSNKKGIYDFFEKKDKAFCIKHELERNFKSYIFYAACGILFVNRYWLFSLNKNLHYDLHIGIDICNKKVGISLYISKTKDILYFSDFNAATINDQRIRREKLSAPLIKKYLYDFLKKHLPLFNIRPEAILIHRDGKAFEEEWEGIQSAVNDLKNESIIPAKIKIGVVEIYKSSVTLPRIVTEKNGQLTNSRWGTYYLINSREALLLTTGYPGKLKGTAKPLIIRKAYGEVDFIKALQDINDLSYLCYSTPDKKHRLPVIIKIIDELLTPASYSIDTPGIDIEEDNEETVIENSNQIINNISQLKGAVP